MSSLASLKVRYAKLIEEQGNLPKHKRRYPEEFRRDLAAYINEGGSRKELAAWMQLRPDSVSALAMRVSIRKGRADQPSNPDHVSGFVRVSESHSGDGSDLITITYPSGLTLKIPLKA